MGFLGIAATTNHCNQFRCAGAGAGAGAGGGGGGGGGGFCSRFHFRKRKSKQRDPWLGWGHLRTPLAKGRQAQNYSSQEGALPKGYVDILS